MQSRVTVMLKEALNGGLFVEKHPLVFINWRCLLLHQANRVLCNYYCLNPFRCLQLSTGVKGSLHSSVNRHVNHLALFDMPNLNRFDILSISIFCKIEDYDRMIRIILLTTISCTISCPSFLPQFSIQCEKYSRQELWKHWLGAILWMQVIACYE